MDKRINVQYTCTQYTKCSLFCSDFLLNTEGFKFIIAVVTAVIHLRTREVKLVSEEDVNGVMLLQRLVTINEASIAHLT